jgi:hypothetical protein
MALDDARKCGGKSRRLSNSRTAAQPMAAAGSLDQLSFEAEGFKTVVAVTSERAHLSRDGPEETAGTLCCWECTAVPAKLLTCSRCKVARYCSKACQKAAWKAEFTGVGHKDTCKTFLENLRPEGVPEDHGKCAAISAAGSSWLSCGPGDYDDELQECLEAREAAFWADPALPSVLHLTISCTNALDTVRLGISATFHHGRPMYAMDLVYASVDEGPRAAALLDQGPSGTLAPAARARAVDAIVRFGERAAAAGKGASIKAILLGRGVTWLADEDAPEHDALLARLRAAGLGELLGMHVGSNHSMAAMVGAMMPAVGEEAAAAMEAAGASAPPASEDAAGDAEDAAAVARRERAERLAEGQHVVAAAEGEPQPDDTQ